MLNEPTDPRARLDIEALRRAAAPLGMTMVAASLSDASAIRPAVKALADQKVDAIVTGTSLVYNLRVPLIEITNSFRMPVAGHRGELADAGALFAYGAVLSDQIRAAARMADRIFKGASPASMAIEQPTKYEFVLNQNAAKLLGVKIPAPLLLRADRVIA